MVGSNWIGVVDGYDGWLEGLSTSRPSFIFRKTLHAITFVKAMFGTVNIACKTAGKDGAKMLMTVNRLRPAVTLLYTLARDQLGERIDLQIVQLPRLQHHF